MRVLLNHFPCCCSAGVPPVSGRAFSSACDSDHRFLRIREQILGFGRMKSLLQFVALVVMALLASPPGVAEGLCLLGQSGQTPSMECCVSAGHISVSEAGVPPSMAPDCTGGCCSVAPSSPAPSAPYTLKIDSSVVDVQLPANVITLRTASGLASSATHAVNATTDLQVLLRTFRI